MTTNIDYSLLKGQKLKIAVSEILNNPEWLSNISKLIDIHGYKLTNSFFSCSYNENLLISKRAIRCFGLLASKTPTNQKEKIRNLMRKCIWMLTEESGGIPWTVPEIMGAVMSSDKIIAVEYKNILLSYIYEHESDYDNFLENTELRKSVFIAIEQLSQHFPELILQETDIIGQRINREDNPEIVANLCMIISNSNLTGYEDYIKHFFSIDELIEIYSDDRIKTVTHGNIAHNSYDKMKNLF